MIFLHFKKEKVTEPDKRNGRKYDFILNKRRYTKKYFKTKAEAREEEARRREKRLEAGIWCY